MAWTALLIGLGGSLHCVGMCGPLALSLSGGTDGGLRFVAGRILYNTGRLLTYATLGALFGLVGGAVQWAGWQQSLSIGVGVVILTGTVLALLNRRLPVQSVPARFVGVVKARLAKLLRVDSLPGLLFVGVLNGLLPCGLVYVALAGSLTAGGPVQGAIYMALFGAGTIPLMLATSIAGRALLRPQMLVWVRRAIPAGMLMLGSWFVLRGLGLGIPLLSPAMGGSGMVCH